MYFEYNIILTFITFGASIVIFVLNFLNYIDSKSRIERNVLLTHVFLLISHAFFIFTLLFPTENQFLFQLIPLIHTLAIIYTFHVFYTLVGMSGNSRSLKEKMTIMIYVTIGLLASNLYNYFYLNIKFIEGRTYYGVNPFNILFASIYLAPPLIHIIHTSSKSLFQHFSKESKMELGMYFYVLVGFVVTCAFMMLELEFRMFSYYFFIAIMVLNLVLFYKKPKILIHFGSALGVKSIYIVRNNGMTIYTKDFSHATVINKEDKSRINLLIGGFVYAISHGIREIIRKEYEANLKSMDFGPIKMIFGYGEKVFGVLFTHSVNDYLQRKLTEFVHTFEEKNEEILDSLMGDVTYMSKKPKKGSKSEEFVNKTEDLLREFFN